jgi:singapore isolate B (sub-type 7) whole genome shotgun sequence assembly, scaffold_15
LLIAGAGAVTPSDNASYSFSDLYDYVLKANVTTCYNTVLPIVDRMRERRRGQICIFSSVAGLGMNFISPLYSSAKIAVQGFGEGRVPYSLFTQLFKPSSLAMVCM